MIRRILYCALVCVFLVGCLTSSVLAADSGEPGTDYAVHISELGPVGMQVQGADGNWTEISPNEPYPLQAGQQARFKAVPDANCEIALFTIDGEDILLNRTEADPTYEFVLAGNSNHSVYVESTTFGPWVEPAGTPLDLSVEGPGDVYWRGQCGTEMYLPARESTYTTTLDEIMLVARPEAKGAEITSILVDGVEMYHPTEPASDYSEDGYTFKVPMTKPRTSVSVTFTSSSYPLTLKIEGEGTVVLTPPFGAGEPEEFPGGTRELPVGTCFLDMTADPGYVVGTCTIKIGDSVYAEDHYRSSSVSSFELQEPGAECMVTFVPENTVGALKTDSNLLCDILATIPDPTHPDAPSSYWKVGEFAPLGDLTIMLRPANVGYTVKTVMVNGTPVEIKIEDPASFVEFPMTIHAGENTIDVELEPISNTSVPIQIQYESNADKHRYGYAQVMIPWAGGDSLIGPEIPAGTYTFQVQPNWCNSIKSITVNGEAIGFESVPDANPGTVKFDAAVAEPECNIVITVEAPETPSMTLSTLVKMAQEFINGGNITLADLVQAAQMLTAPK